jgi:hypothetical protein
MIGQELKILFHGDKAYLSKDRHLTFEKLGLPVFVKFFKEPAYWKFRVISHIEAQKKIFCEILSYHKGESDFAYNQLQLADKLNNIEIVAFRSIDTNRLLVTMSGTTPNSYTPPSYIPIENTEDSQVQRPHLNFVKEPSIQTITETFFVPLKKVRFKLGGVSFDKKFKDHQEAIELTITNHDIREEFDAVKNYFGNVLRTKRIQVNAKIEIIDNIISSTEVSSPEIAKIDKQLIDNVKFEFVKSTIKKKINVELDKSLFTMDEYFDTFVEEKFESKTFYSNDKELFEDLLTISKTKHYKHLRFLSSKHLHETMKLRFVHKPFSFLFLIQGDRNYHIVWETLDTEEATYVWHLTKDIHSLKLSLMKIEDIINVIKVQGKTAYLNSTVDQFRRVYHDYSNLVDGFVKWKGELESILT